MPILKHYKEEGQPSRWGNPQASGRNPVGTRYTLADPPHEDSGFRIRQTEVEKHRWKGTKTIGRCLKRWRLSPGCASPRRPIPRRPP